MAIITVSKTVVSGSSPDTPAANIFYRQTLAVSLFRNLESGNHERNSCSRNHLLG